MRGLRMPPELEARIDAWIEQRPEPKPSRSEAIRRLIEKGLGHEEEQMN
jgi:Arc/MetJ-type ribon-helix-helix transcriptional regulator